MVLSKGRIWNPSSLVPSARRFGDTLAHGLSPSPARRIFAGSPFFAVFWFLPNNAAEAQALAHQEGINTTTYLLLDLQVDNKVAFAARNGGNKQSALSPNNYVPGVWNTVAIAHRSTSDRAIALNGGTIGTNTALRTPSFTTFTAFIGRLVGSEPFNGRIGPFAIWRNQSVSNSLLQILSTGKLDPRDVHPLKLTDLVLMDGRGGTIEYNYAKGVDATTPETLGDYAINSNPGLAPGPPIARWYPRRKFVDLGAAQQPVVVELSADPGSYAVSGVAATTLRDALVPLDPGSYAISGVAAGAIYDSVVGANPGTYSIGGVLAVLLADRPMSADVAAYVISGVAAGTIADRAILAALGSYLLSGVDATLEQTTAAPQIVADPGAYAVGGTAATVLRASAFSADPGSYANVGAAATVLYDHVVGSDPGSYAVAGLAAFALADRALRLDPGALAVAGILAATLSERIALAASGNYATGGIAATLEGAAAEVVADLAAYAFAGAPGTLERSVPAAASSEVLVLVAATKAGESSLPVTGASPSGPEATAGVVSIPSTGAA